jgi:hypothetical protein
LFTASQFEKKASGEIIPGQHTFRRLDAPELLPDVAHGVEYVNGVRAVNRRDEKVAA